ncbi:MAG: hypothetical protein WA093_00305 [Minisyncoccales bacterium]
MKDIIEQIDRRIDFDRIIRIAGDLALIGAFIALVGMFTAEPIFRLGAILMVPFAIVLIIIIVMVVMMLIWFSFKDLWDELNHRRNE